MQGTVERGSSPSLGEYRPDRPDFRTRDLIATWKSTNRSKHDKDRSEWLPPNRAYWCTYLDDWVRIKRAWGLSIGC